MKIYLVLKETGSLQIWNQKSVVVRTQKEREDGKLFVVDVRLNDQSILKCQLAFIFSVSLDLKAKAFLKKCSTI